MTGYGRDDGWILVSRGRKRHEQRRRPGPPNPDRHGWLRHDSRNAPDVYRWNGRDGRPYRSRERRSYASVTRMSSRRDGYPPEQRFQKRGLQPQFFEPRGRSAAPHNPNHNYKNHNARSHSKGNAAGPQNNNKNNLKTTNKNKTRSDDPDFGLKIRSMFKIIKIIHHLKNASAQQPPPTIKKLTINLANTIKPANPNQRTSLLLEGNARNWEVTTMMILQDHYHYELELELGALTQLAPRGWEGPFQVASIWAKRSLGRRLQGETLEQARAQIIAGVGGEKMAGPAPPSLPVSSPPPPPAADPPAAETAEDMGTTGEQHTVTVEVHQPPRRSELAPASPVPPTSIQKVSVGTETEELDGWSPIREEILLDIPAQDKSPQPQRTPHAARLLTTATSSPASNPCCAVESDSILDAPIETDLLIDLSEQKLVPVSTPVEGAGQMARRLRSAVQSQLNIGAHITPQKPDSPEPETRRPTRHINTKNKKQDAGLGSECKQEMADSGGFQREQVSPVCK